MLLFQDVTPCHNKAKEKAKYAFVSISPILPKERIESNVMLVLLLFLLFLLNNDELEEEQQQLSS